MTGPHLVPFRAAEEWDGQLPAVLVERAESVAQRRALLCALAARVLGLTADAVAMCFEEGAPPRLVRPEQATLYASSASRDGLAAVAVADHAIGIDLERVTAGDLPWNVLHRDETCALRALPAAHRPLAFARLWSVKEAYLKALGMGLSREPASFAVHLAGHATAAVRDGGRTIPARTAWIGRDPRYALALVTLSPRPAATSSH